MRLRTYYRRILIMLLIAAIIGGLGYCRYYMNKWLPDKITIIKDSNELIQLPFGKEVNINGNKIGSYVVDVRLLGIIRLKDVDVSVVEDKYIYPGGMAIGMYLQTDGVMVIGTGQVVDMNGNKLCPVGNLVREGDYIVKLNDIDISSKSQLIFLINKYGNKDVVLKLRRNEAYMDIRVKPIEISPGAYKLGIWVRDDAQGIGTITYITEDNKFGALGHGVSDVDTGRLLDARGGLLYKAHIWGIEKGKPGIPGGLCGYIVYEKDNILGQINKNSSVGIYGDLEKLPDKNTKTKKIPVGYKQEVNVGRAYIKSNVSGKSAYYEIEIIKVNKENGNKKNMIIKVVDKTLLKLTGGIVQGMSGSPIIQDGKIIGAVTHVFVSDPTRGYGIFIEEMLTE